MKKVIALVLTVCVVCAAGAAFAHQNQQQANHPVLANVQEGREHRNQQQVNHPDFPAFREDRGQHCFEGRNDNRGFGFEGRRGMFAPDMPQEIRAKVSEAAKLRVDLEEVLSYAPLDKAKALEVHAKIQQAEAEIETWRFSKKLDMIESFRKKLPAPTPEVKQEQK